MSFIINFPVAGIPDSGEQCVFHDNTPIVHPGGLSMETLKTITIPPLGKNDSLRIDVDWEMVGIAAAKNLLVELAGVTVMNTAALTASVNTAKWRQEIHNQNDTNVQSCLSNYKVDDAYVETSANPESLTIDTSVSTNLVFKGQLVDAADDITITHIRACILRATV